MKEQLPNRSRENMNRLKKAETSKEYRMLKIRQIIKLNGACLYCIRKWNGKVKKYKTDC